jgi:hypothetical protein
MEGVRGRKRTRSSSSRLSIAALLSAPVEASRVCAACLAHPVVDGRACAECSTGSFCYECLETYARAAVKDRALLPLRCGEADCRAVIPPAAIAAVVDRELASLYFVAVDANDRNARRKRRRFSLDDSDLLETDDEGGQDENDKAVLRLLRSEGWQRCPDCGFGVEKVVGCRHMRCICGGQFCYGCGGRWGTGGCARRCGFGTGLAMFLDFPGTACVGSDLWDGLVAQVSQRMLRILQELHNQADRQRCGFGPRLDVAVEVPPGVRRRGRRSRGLAVEELVHSCDAAVPAAADYRGPSLPHLSANMEHPPSLCPLQTSSSRRSMKLSSLVLHNLDYLVHDRDEQPCSTTAFSPPRPSL